MKVTKTFQWDCSHKLCLPYESKCNAMHGHTYKIEVELEGNLDDNGMVMDFVKLKELVNKISLDHSTINENEFFKAMKWQPTAENMVLYIKHKLDAQWKPGWPLISRIRVWETPTSYAEETWYPAHQQLLNSIKIQHDKIELLKEQLGAAATRLAKIATWIDQKRKG